MSHKVVLPSQPPDLPHQRQVMFKGHGILGLYTASVQSSKDQSVTIACSQLIGTDQSSALTWLVEPIIPKIFF